MVNILPVAGRGEIELLVVRDCFEEVITLRVVAVGDALRLICFSFHLWRPAFQACSGHRGNELSEPILASTKWTSTSVTDSLRGSE